MKANIPNTDLQDLSPTCIVKELSEKSMEKIYNQLNKFHKEIKESNEYNIKKDYLEEERKNIESKYKDYKLNSETKNKVMDFIKDIYKDDIQ